MTEPSPYPCSLCDYVGRTAAELYGHISTAHPTKPRPTDKPSPRGPKPWNPKKKR